MTAMKKLLLLIAVLSIGATITLLTTYYQQPHQAIVGKGCTVSDRNWDGYCYETLTAGGFPIPFLFDSGKTATKGTLGFDDEFYKFLFVGDLLLYSFLVGMIILGLYVYRNRGKT